jgi:ABC-2 type transport system ATP-binding protein
MTAVETEGLTRFYGDLCAVRDLTLSVDGEIFGLLGPNGSGKTTTVKMLTTLLLPSSGSARICGHDVVREAPAVRERISYVPQEMAVGIKLTGRENVLLFARLYGVPAPRDRTDQALALMGLSDRADDRTAKYSGGMRRRLELAQALVHEPAVLFLDEPTIGLDVAARKRIWEHIISLRHDGVTVFVTTHYMDEADRACDRVAFLDRGSVVMLGSPSSLKASIPGETIIARISGSFTPQEIPGLTFVGQRGDLLTFTGPRTQDGITSIQRELDHQGIPVHEIGRREPTLDDVFLQAVGSQDAAGPFDDHRFRLILRRRG